MTTTEIKTRPIIFTGDSVRAILDGRKVMTRRVVKPQPEHGVRFFNGGKLWHNKRCDPNHHKVPFNTGDRLWVRETWMNCATHGIKYRADDRFGRCRAWRPPMHMPREFSRLTLEVVSVRVERVQEISNEGCLAEGVCGDISTQREPLDRFPAHWDSINAKRGYGWDVNPWVWCVEFMKVETP